MTTKAEDATGRVDDKKDNNGSDWLVDPSPPTHVVVRDIVNKGRSRFAKSSPPRCGRECRQEDTRLQYSQICCWYSSQLSKIMSHLRLFCTTHGDELVDILAALVGGCCCSTKYSGIEEAVVVR